MTPVQAFQNAVAHWAAGGPGAPAADLAAQLDLHTAVLLEGPSDLAALEALAAQQGRELAAEGLCVIPLGGAMSVGRYARLLGPPGLGMRLAGLCDEGEQRFYHRALNHGQGAGHRIHVCVTDLEDELVRALGTAAVEEIIRTEGDLRPWQTFLQQPAQHHRSRQQQLRRFLGTKKGRKVHYSRLLAQALTPHHPATPLHSLLSALRPAAANTAPHHRRQRP